MRVEDITIKSNIKNYKAHFEENEEFLKSLANLENSVFVIDENVYKMHKDGCLKYINQDRLIILQICEELKNIDTVCELYEKIMQFAPRKNLNLISIGGGITQDLTGFVASSLYRGVNWIFVPTTLLAQEIRIYRKIQWRRFLFRCWRNGKTSSYEWRRRYKNIC